MMVTDESDLTIVRSTIDLSHNLGLDVVAEGVEDADTLEQLSEMGCDRAQGYFLSAVPCPPTSCWSGSATRPAGPRPPKCSSASAARRWQAI